MNVAKPQHDYSLILRRTLSDTGPNIARTLAGCCPANARMIHRVLRGHFADVDSPWPVHGLIAVSAKSEKWTGRDLSAVTDWTRLRTVRGHGQTAVVVVDWSWSRTGRGHGLVVVTDFVWTRSGQ